MLSPMIMPKIMIYRLIQSWWHSLFPPGGSTAAASTGNSGSTISGGSTPLSVSTGSGRPSLSVLSHFFFAFLSFFDIFHWFHSFPSPQMHHLACVCKLPWGATAKWRRPEVKSKRRLSWIGLKRPACEIVLQVGNPVPQLRNQDLDWSKLGYWCTSSSRWCIIKLLHNHPHSSKI